MTGEGQVGHTTEHDLIIYVQDVHYSYCTYLAHIYYTVQKGINILFLNILVKAVLLEISIFQLLYGNYILQRNLSFNDLLF